MHWIPYIIRFLLTTDNVLKKENGYTIDNAKNESIIGDTHPIKQLIINLWIGQ